MSINQLLLQNYSGGHSAPRAVVLLFSRNQPNASIVKLREGQVRLGKRNWFTSLLIEDGKALALDYLHSLNLPMKHLPGLNGLRAISVLLVILYHLQAYYQYGKHIIINEAWALFYNGELGVNVFFVLSGYLITTLLRKEEERTGEISLRRFYVRRTLRIFPAYYFLLAFYFFMQLAGKLFITTGSWLSALTYTKDIFYGEWYLAHAWSLSLEEQFYLVWPLLFTVLKTRRRFLALAIVTIVPLLRGLSYQFHFSWAGTASNSLRIDALMWGCVFALYDKPMVGFLKRSIARHRLVVALPFLLIIGSYYFSLFNRDAHLHLGPLLMALAHPNGSLIYVAIGFVMLISIHYQETGWAKFLNLPPLDYLGKLSYSLYLWQQVFIGMPFLFKSVPLNLFCIFLMANVSYYCIEKPFLKLRDRLQKRTSIKAAVLPIAPA